MNMEALSYSQQSFKKSSETTSADDPTIDTSTILIIPNCISESVVKTIVSLRSHFDNSTMVQDRTDDLEFSHVVHRIEGILKKKHPELLYGLISLMLHMDVWNVMNEPVESIEEIPEQLFPEIEYLTYEASEKAGFGRHRDNGSLITAIFMLSSRVEGDFKGGQLFFDENREVQLQRGECVIFRGEELFHQVKPIVSGERRVLQIVSAKWVC